MHVVAIAWLFVAATMAMTLSSPLAGVAWFAGVGLLPLALLAALLVRRRRRSMLEQDVHAGDDPDAEHDRQHLARGFDGVRPAVQARDEVRHRHVE